MNFVIIDLEWNGAFSKKAHGYFNEIIEIGAVKMDADLQEVDRFQAVIHPVVSKKLTDLVTNLTNITDAELEDGGTFAGAMAAFQRFVGKTDAVILTWSTTDLLVLLENYRYFCKTDTIPFMQAYLDLQAYYQRRRQLPSGQQVGLAAACEQLGIDANDVDHHRALDDSILTGRILQKVYDPASFATQMAVANTDFYRRITYKNRYITDSHDPCVKPEYLQFRCDVCHRWLRTEGKWRAHNRSICANMLCNSCHQTFTACVQIKQKYDTVDVKRKLTQRKLTEEKGSVSNEETGCQTEQS